MESRIYGLEGDTEKVEKLHESRRIFAIVRGKVEIAPEGVPYSHKEWLETLNLEPEEIDEIMNNGLRGYVNPEGNIYFYKGYDFDFDESVHNQVNPVINELKQKLELPRSGQVYGGVQKGEAGKVWPPKTILGSVKDFEGVE